MKIKSTPKESKMIIVVLRINSLVDFCKEFKVPLNSVIIALINI